MAGAQRADDADMSVDIVSVTGLGRLIRRARRRRVVRRPQCAGELKLECRALARLLPHYPLAARARERSGGGSATDGRNAARLS